MVERKVSQAKETNLDQAKLTFEEKVLRGEVIFSRQTALREVFHVGGVDNVGLLDESPLFEIRELPESFLYIVSFQPNSVSLGGERLVKVLTGAKSVKATKTQNKEQVRVHDRGVSLNSQNEILRLNLVSSLSSTFLKPPSLAAWVWWFLFVCWVQYPAEKRCWIYY